jgi:uncharacterized membrane protein
MNGLRTFAMAALAATFCAVGAIAAAAPDAGPLRPGRTLRDVVPVGGKQIPLPAGEWIVAGMGRSIADTASYGAHGTVENLVLLRVDKDRIDGIAELHANSIPTDAGWGLPDDCTRKDLPLVVNRFKSGWEGSCFLVKLGALRKDEGTGQAWRDALAFGSTRGWRFTTGWVTAAFRESDRRDIIDARFHFDPAGQGFKPIVPNGRADAEWRPPALLKDSLKLGYLQQIAAWAASFDRLIDLGLRNQLEADAVFPDPFGPLALSQQPDLDGKLLMLDRLARTGVITRDQQGELERAALDDRKEVTAESWIAEPDRKRISFRMLGAAIDWILAYAVTLNAPLSTAIAVTTASVHSTLFATNDQFWDSYWRENGVRDGARRLDFPYGMRDL